MDDQTVFWITQFWSFAAVVCCVYLGGEAAKRAVSLLVSGKDAPPRWYAFWKATIRWHPFGVGALCGLLPGLDPPVWVPDTLLARALWFGLAGALSGQLYGAIKDSAAHLPSLIGAKVKDTSAERNEAPTASAGAAEEEEDAS